MNSKVVFDMVTSLTQYAAGDLIGSMVANTSSEFSFGSEKKISVITVHDLAKQSVPMSVIFADAPFTSTTFTDNGALDVGDADLFKIIGVASISHTHYQGFADNSVATLKDVNIPFVTSTTGQLYAALVTNGSPTYASIGDLKLTLLLE